MALNDIILKDYQSAEKYLNTIIIHPKSITLNYNEYRGNGIQTVPYRSASYNLLGFINSENAKIEDAEKMFNAALEYMPDYVLAKENLIALENAKQND